MPLSARALLPFMLRIRTVAKPTIMMADIRIRSGSLLTRWSSLHDIDHIINTAQHDGITTNHRAQGEFYFCYLSDWQAGSNLLVWLVGRPHQRSSPDKAEQPRSQAGAAPSFLESSDRRETKLFLISSWIIVRSVSSTSNSTRKPIQPSETLSANNLFPYRTCRLALLIWRESIGTTWSDGSAQQHMSWRLPELCWTKSTYHYDTIREIAIHIPWDGLHTTTLS